MSSIPVLKSTPKGQTIVPVYRSDDPLADLVAYTHQSEALESIASIEAEWISQLQLDLPRENIHCISLRTRIAKRTLDIVFATTLLILLSPVMVLTAIAVKLTSPGSAIFSQRRVGLNLRKKHSDRRQDESELPEPIDSCRRKNRDRRQEFKYGREFTLYKFRTMRTDAEKNGAQFAQKNDPRVTTIGRIMRKTRLDELPQLWNVLKGEMSMVGPRPERPEFIKNLSQEIPNYIYRLGLKPGLTGLAQIENGYDNNLESFERKVAYDLMYLQNCCFWNDLKILFRTIRVVLTGSGAL